HDALPILATETSIGQLFIAGIGPGVLIGLSLIVFLAVWCRLRGYGLRDGEHRMALWLAFKRSAIALLMPVVVIGGIYGGVFTPTEASAVAVFYALAVGMILYRELKFRDLP